MISNKLGLFKVYKVEKLPVIPYYAIFEKVRIIIKPLFHKSSQTKTPSYFHLHQNAVFVICLFLCRGNNLIKSITLSHPVQNYRTRGGLVIFKHQRIS